MTQCRHLLIALCLPLFLLLVAAPTPYMGAAYAATGDEEPQGSPATGTLQTRDAQGVIKSCKDVPEAKGGVLLGAIIPCLTYTIEQSTMNFSAKMVDAFRPLLYTFLVLVVTLFGVRMLQHEPQLEKQGFLLLLKITLVVTILDMIPGYIVPSVYAIMSEAQTIVLHTLDGASFSCDVASFAGENTPRVWAAMDCVMGKLFGFNAGTSLGPDGQKMPVMVLAPSMFGLLTGFFFSGNWGVVVFFGMLGVLLFSFMLVIRVAMAFIIGYLLVCVMLIICPLFMPLIFMRVTQNYFEGVLRNITAGLLMPVIVAAYAMFALVLYDKVLFAPESLVQKIFKYDEIKDALQNPRKLCDWQVTGDSVTTRLGENASESEIIALFKKNRQMLQTTMSALTGGNDLCARALVSNLNLKDMKNEAFHKGKATYEKMFYDLIQLFLVIWLLYRGMDNLDKIVLQITGMLTTRLGFTPLPGEEKITAAMQNVQQRARAQQDVSGTEFLERAPIAAGDGIKAFFESLGKKK